MKENYTQLYPNEQVGLAVGNYALQHSTKLPKYITDHHAWGVANHEMSSYMISPLQAEFHVWMAKALSAQRILEIGTFIGFSTMCWAHAVGHSGHVTTLEFSPEYAKLAEKAFENNGINNIQVIVGDAKESLKTLAKTIDEPFDLVFIDADKTSYPTYLSLLLSLSTPTSNTPRLLHPGSIILADNILRRGLVADSSPSNPWLAKAKEEKIWREGDMKALDEFNKALVGSERIETFLMPMFDGLGCGRLVD